MRLLGIDLGDVRTGVAVSDVNQTLASPVCVINEKDREKLLVMVLEIAQTYNTGKIILGLPRNMDGTEGESAKKARNFGDLISRKSGIEVLMVDERGTTVTAHNYLNDTNIRGKKRKTVVDTVAATIILQNYLDSLK